MEKGTYQKCKLLYLVKILTEETDEEHQLSIQEMIQKLEKYEISVGYKTLLDDLEMLHHYGYDIITNKNNRAYKYYLGEREFETAELKLLVDSVQASKFITEKKSKELIRKLENLTSKYRAKQLHRQVYISGRVKAVNEAIYYNVDAIHNAIAQDVKITFQYFSWDEKKNPVLRHEGAVYEVSPWGLLWEDENYYLVGYDSKEKMIKHFRVDKMMHIELKYQKREGRRNFSQFDIASYTRKKFGMFDGVEQWVRLQFENELAGVAIDRFGKDLKLYPGTDENHFQINVKVAVSRQFLGWIFSIGSGVQIVAPEEIVDMMKKELQEVADRYRMFDA